ncbi:spore coat putative kinase YutH [Bacillus coahuilensis]|uniref:spore coat putative kinase YutH n=1 Tax=Bacillus coahuilensis TaxID=408580 RepID=UPI0001851291|nr:spore coat protein YutH [Bacillus coahuilensis]
MEDIISKYFGVEMVSSIKDSQYPRYHGKDGLLYTIVNVTNTSQEYLVELYKMTDHLKTSGDLYVSSFVQSIDNKFLITKDDQDYVLLQNKKRLRPKDKQIGRKLAKFHFRGRAIQDKVEFTSRIGKWHELWEKRVNQLENACASIVHSGPTEEFDRLVADAFPYYLGLAENAIQYLVDTEIEGEPEREDAGTVCHARFSNHSWGKEYWIRFPFDWVFDHASRDIADWMRAQYLTRNRTYIPDIQKFVQDYQTITPLSSFTWRLTYARLLFPLHFFEVVEEYYTSKTDHHRHEISDKLERYLKFSGDFERFLGSFFDIVQVPVYSRNIPRIDWLSTSNK